MKIIGILKKISPVALALCALLALAACGKPDNDPCQHRGRDRIFKRHIPIGCLGKK